VLIAKPPQEHECPIAASVKQWARIALESASPQKILQLGAEKDLEAE
jgi:hypothetical protein